jgi:hypothetical protein
MNLRDVASILSPQKVNLPGDLKIFPCGGMKQTPVIIKKSPN